jgi:hypothetical protein
MRFHRMITPALSPVSISLSLHQKKKKKTQKRVLGGRGSAQCPDIRTVSLKYTLAFLLLDIPNSNGAIGGARHQLIQTHNLWQVSRQDKNKMEKKVHSFGLTRRYLHCSYNSFVSGECRDGCEVRVIFNFGP